MNDPRIRAKTAHMQCVDLPQGVRVMSLRSIVIAAFASVLMLSSAGAMAQGHGGGGGFHGGGGGYHGGGYHGGGWGHSSVFIGGDFGFWPGYPYGYGYDPYYYGYPPVAYAPPQPVAYYAPPPVAGTAPAATAPVAAANPAIDQSYCRQYQGTVMIDGATQPSNGVACRQPDGNWRIVQ